MLSIVFFSQKLIPEGQDFCLCELAACYTILHGEQLGCAVRALHVWMLRL